MKLGTFLLLLVIDMLIFILSNEAMPSPNFWTAACYSVSMVASGILGIVGVIVLFAIAVKAINDNFDTKIKNLLP